MFPLIAMALSLALLVALLRVKVRIGRSMLAAAILLAFTLQVTPASLTQQLATEWSEKPLSLTTGYIVVTITILLTMVNLLGLAMRETGVADRLLPALHGLFRSRRVALAAIPMMMGMLPTPGGIMLSAPLVRAPGDSIGISRSRLAAINFWFRHQWESTWPLFPAVPLIQAMFEISPWQLLSHNVILTASGILGGVVFLLLKGIPSRDKSADPGHRSLGHNLRNFAAAFWPIATTAGLYAAFRLPPALGLVLATSIFLIVYRVPPKRLWAMFKGSMELDIALLVIGALLFKVDLEAAGAVPEVVAFLVSAHVPQYLFIFLLPFLVGFLTGMTIPTVAITFPFLLEFIGTGPTANMPLETLAFAGLLCGLFTTPVHLCLALSCSYFEVPFWALLRKQLGPVIVLAGAAVALVIFSA